jgi:hypothetical protein
LLEQKDFLLQMSPVTTRELQEHRFPSLPYFLMRAHEETDPELLMSNSPTAVYVGFLRGSNGSTFLSRVLCETRGEYCHGYYR